MNHTFTLSTQTIDLNKLLKVLSLVDSWGEAKKLIPEGKVMVNGEIELRIRRKLTVGDVVKFGENTITLD